MKALLLVAVSELRQRLRDRSALVMAFLAPLALTVLISLIPFGTSFRTTFVVANEDEGPLGAIFVERVLGSSEIRDIADIIDVSSEDAARQAIADGRGDAAFVLPRDVSADAAATGSGATITVIQRGQSPIAGDIARSIATEFAARVEAFRLVSQSAPTSQRPDLVPSTLASDSGAVVTDPEIAGDRRLTAADYFTPAMAIFFLFFTVGFGARSLLIERSQGTLERLRASPVAPRAVIAGKALSSFVLGLVSMLVVFGASAVLLGARWGNPLGVLALMVAVTLVATAIAWLLATFARTEEQATGYTSLAAVGLALLGGSFFSLAEAPESLQRLALLTPNGQALQGFTDLAVGVGGEALLRHLSVIGGFVLVVGALAFLRSNRLVRA